MAIGNMHRKFVKIARVVPGISTQTDRQTDTQTDTQTHTHTVPIAVLGPLKWLTTTHD